MFVRWGESVWDGVSFKNLFVLKMGIAVENLVTTQSPLIKAFSAVFFSGMVKSHIVM